jgi:hypothetical protein
VAYIPVRVFIELGAEEPEEAGATGLRAEETDATELGAEEAGAADAGLFLPLVVRFPMAALRAANFALASFTTISFKEGAFTGFFFAPVTDLEAIREES